jgi:hypothetical protein
MILPIRLFERRLRLLLALFRTARTGLRSGLELPPAHRAFPGVALDVPGLTQTVRTLLHFPLPSISSFSRCIFSDPIPLLNQPVTP